jgi:2C-methyl-D-erythritol 2,4-cyclodiphosphate synthase
LDNIPSDVSEEELEEIIKQSLAETLNTHPQNVEVQIDMETGEVTFTLTSDDITEVQQAQFDMNNDIIVDALSENIETSIPGVVFQNVEIEETIAAEVEVIVDADNATNDLTQAAFQAEKIFSDDFEVNVKTDYVTMAPSQPPTTVPTTSIPTIAPTITGAVALIELSSVVTEEVSAETLDDISKEIVKEYGVEEEDVQIEVDYIVNGTLDIEGELPTDLEERQLLIETLEDELAELLGLHEGDVNVTINENNEIVYD